MTMTRLLILAVAAAPALMLGACKKGADAGPANAALSQPAIPAPAGGWTQQVRRTDEGGYLMGNPDAPVKLVEYGSRTCPVCGRFASEGYAELKSKYVATGRVSFEFRDFAVHAPDMGAILLGQCTTPQAFFGILEQMYAEQPAIFEKLNALPPGFQEGLQGKSASQQATAWADYLGYTGFVGQRGIPAAKARACLSDDKAVEAFAQRMATASSRDNVTGTPTFLVNGEMQQQVVAWSQLEPKLRAALGE